MLSKVLIPLESGLVVNGLARQSGGVGRVLIPLESGLVVNWELSFLFDNKGLNPFGIRAGCEPYTMDGFDFKSKVLIPLESGLVVNADDDQPLHLQRLNPFGIRAGCEHLDSG